MYSVQELENLVKRHNRLYWDLNAPEISDVEYDSLVEALRKASPESLVLQNLGQSIAEIGNTVKHDKEMLSLDKCYNETDLLKWATKFKQIVYSPKVDGMACSLIYEYGVFILGATRGDGSVGEDITANLLNIVPKTLNTKLPKLEVRGELYLPISVFNTLSGFSNPRNAVAGMLKRKENSSQGVQFLTYDLLSEDLQLDTFTDRMVLASNLGFNTVPYTLVCNNEYQAGYDSILMNKDNLDYELDGVVYRANLISEYERAGYTSHHPKGAMAYKFQGEFGKTKLIGVEWQISRTGILTPVALVEPVKLSGAIVGRISLHHAGMIKTKGLSLNAEVLAVRRGGVIPHLEKVIKSGNEEIEIPSVCYNCNSPTKMDGDFLICTLNCSLDTKVIHFLDRMGIEGIGPSWVETLIKEGLISKLSDIYRLTSDKLLQIESVGEVRAEGWLSSINKSKSIPLNLFLEGLGIEGLGRKASDVLSVKYKTLDAVLNLRQTDIETIDGFGSITASSIVNGLKASKELIDDLLQFVMIGTGEKKEGVLSGLSFLFTGTLNRMKRSDAENKVVENGGNIASSVSKNLSYLVAGEKAGSKLEKAQSLGIKILTEDQFINMFL